MSAAKHTPGPWNLVDDKAYGPAPWQRRWAINAADPDATPKSGYLVHVVSLAQDAKRGEADARLIAAAPELLAACEAVLEVLATPSKPSALCITVLAQAIAKATGGAE